MPGGEATPSGERVLIAGPPGVLLQIAAALAADPATTVLSVSPMGPGGPERIVAAVPPERLAALHEAFGDLVLIEPDQPLGPLQP